jgi:MinD-like ATPase involved in chromosome partitioning or flagellar assembly
MINLTKDDILSDIKAYEDRICVTQQKLSLLPSAASTYKERRKIKSKKLILLKEIDHVRGLISIAEEALNQP